MSIDRTAGILLPISSLSSPYGIGTLGKKAYEFADFLKKAGQKYWQILPIGPTSYGDSPYQSFSAFAGNPYFIDLDILKEEGLLTEEDTGNLEVRDPEYIDYADIYNTRFDVLYKAYRRGMESRKETFVAFCEENSGWLEDYALFMAIKKHFGMISWQEWPDERIRMRESEAMEEYRQRLNDDVQFYAFLQFLFYEQYANLKKYVNDLQIGIIGDIPIYVALDSADVWARPESFQLDERRRPTEVAGVPPDYFSEDGQLWGNPLYDWKRMKEDGYSFWLERMESVSRIFDVVRIDHFRGFADYWAVPFGETTAKNGRWRFGPGITFINLLKERFPHLEFIAEDLGEINQLVEDLLADSGFPGMRILEFAMSPDSAYLPHNHTENSVCYIGTHDHEPVLGWYEGTDENTRRFANAYLGLNEKEGIAYGFIRGGMASVARLFVCQMQDYLELGKEATTNSPGTMGTNWRWRLKEGQLNDALAERINTITRLYGRQPEKQEKTVVLTQATD